MTSSTDYERGIKEGRRQAFEDMMTHARAIILGAEDKPQPVYGLFIKAIEAANEGKRPPHPSLSMAEQRSIARKFISERGDKLFVD